MKSISASSVSELKHVVKSILRDLPDHFVFAIAGNMGVGKTTIIKAFCKELGVEAVVSSPTFALINEYSSNKHYPIYHFDFYRVKKINEVFDIGYEGYFYSGHYCFIEWPEIVMELLPNSYVYITIEEEDNGRRLITYSIQ
ncbi:MAG: tRNA (adenosine(37)-N6)-threonylcarbamoyltransferase complex ATPase subunit type 1 TsaE [Bacteroidetes bacterium]|jgi:tRNA threonylcarbamoyladenosine biosynthesis protein TsaE|nr:tRNA (adenosine(37)-N6)-threonylcarbamoyltransferase complex ATPase subunit type 1 TsaE [Bacteroidota bacterium]|tara:strand:+ start:847 stop:1269 length:423 start_codon:yes stop_codon:yes gene_type:complete